MKQIIKDERTADEKQHQQYFVMGTDTFMSGWGQAKDMVSYAVWVFDSEDNMPKYLKWVKSRGDMKNIMSGTTKNLEFLINQMALNLKRRNNGIGQHISIYQTTEHHPALD